MLQLNTLVRFIHSHSPARLSKFKKILARRPKSVPTPGVKEPKMVKKFCCFSLRPDIMEVIRSNILLVSFLQTFIKQLKPR